MTDWKAAMLCILPLMMETRACRTWRALLHFQKPRAWLAVFLSSVLAWMFPLNPIAYLITDLVCGAIVIQKPAGWPQKWIGRVFAIMVVFDAGYLLTPRVDDGILYREIMVFLGWAQFAVLFTWGGYDAFRYSFRRVWGDRRVLASGENAR